MATGIPPTHWVNPNPPAPAQKPPATTVGWIGWLRAHLFSTPANSVLTLATLWFLYWVGGGLARWLAGAFWEPIWANRKLFAALIPLGGRAQAVMAAGLVLLLAGYWLGARGGVASRWLVAGWILSGPLTFVLLGGVGLPLLGDSPAVDSNLWGGLMLTMLLAVVGIALSFPVGVLLALGRRSKLPVIRYFSIGYIELIRGVPLITLLFMGMTMLPLFLPSGWGNPSQLVRAMTAITFFSAAYLAENVRGGLQAIPKGQYEAADALGLSGLDSLRFIILPQALVKVIPAIVGQFIGLFKDTSLV
ncbi:MAG: amino acid ABC transporter permease, partial [Caldilinea sp.]|nr:amino acid ABC transporter permease [Caldilinea sp.]